MIERDSLLERLERMNPVPDPSRLYEDVLEAPGIVPSGATHGLAPHRGEPPTRRGLLVAVTAAAVVIMVAVAISVIAINSNDLVAGDSRVLWLAIEDDGCRYEGPSMLAAGDAEIRYRNMSSTTRWANTLRLDDDRTVADVLSYTADDPLAGAPAWSKPVWLALNVSADGKSTSRVVTLEPGTHVLLCGDATRGAVFGADVLVTP